MRFTTIMAATFVALATSTAALPAVFISEAAPWSSGNSAFGNDWFEVTNGGSTPLDITGWRMDDNSYNFALSVPLSGITTIAPGESVIFVENPDQNAAITGFAMDWFGGNAPKGLQIGNYSGSGVGLSTGGDAVNLFNAAGATMASINFGPSTPAPVLQTFDNSAGLTNNATITTLSVVGVNGAFKSVNPVPGNTEIGSPGTIGGPTTPTPPTTPPPPPAPQPTSAPVPPTASPTKLPTPPTVAPVRPPSNPPSLRPVAPPTKSHNKDNNAKSGLNFFIFGDWGHNVPAATSESGVAFEEQIIANQVGIFADKIKPSFFAVLGDNFYEAGPVNTTDPIWQNYYRSVFTAPSTFVPWYPILGNHDYYAGGSPQAQIDYYYEQRDSRWTFPDYQYTRKWNVPGTEKAVEIVFINTPPLCPESSQSNIGWPTSAQAITLIWQPVAQWIKNALAASTADYLLVAGHYSVYTNGDVNDGIGSAEYNCGIQRLVPLMKEYGVAAYMHGHKHNFQHHFIDGMNYIDVGHGCDKSGKLQPGTPTGLLFNRTVGGFAHVHVGGIGIDFRFIDENGNYIYNATVTNPPHRRRMAKLAMTNRF